MQLSTYKFLLKVNINAITYNVSGCNDDTPCLASVDLTMSPIGSRVMICCIYFKHFIWSFLLLHCSGSLGSKLSGET